MMYYDRNVLDIIILTGTEVIVEKRREPLTTFKWRKDAGGYDLSPDRQRIVRRGGVMDEYDPATVEPPLYRTFASLAQSALNPDRSSWGMPDVPDTFYDPSAPWGKRRYPNFESALLEFVREFGFLGSDRSGADVEYETVDYLREAASKLESFQDVCWNEEKEPEKIFDKPFAGPNIRMYLGPGKGKAKILQVHYEPESLYAWMWLRIADEFSSGVRWDGPPCLYCSQTMGRGPGGHRSDAKFCTDTCRTYFHRLTVTEQKRRRTKARALQRNQKEA